MEDIDFLREAVSIAKHVAVVEIEKEIRGGIMIFQRWHNAVWVTNIFIETFYQSRGISLALYKYTLQYCDDKNIQWAFCNPIARILPLHQRWGIVPLNEWESLSLVALYNYLFKADLAQISFPFNVHKRKGVLQIENKDILIRLIPNKQQLVVIDRNCSKKNKSIFLPEAYRLRLNGQRSYIKLINNWYFDVDNGQIINQLEDIRFYAPTAIKMNLTKLTIPIDDLKKPLNWSYENNNLHATYTNLGENSIVQLTVIFGDGVVKLMIDAKPNWYPRLVLEHGLLNNILPRVITPTLTNTITYTSRVQRIYNGIGQQIVIELGENGLIHKRYLRSFIPRSHRPPIRGVKYATNHLDLPLAAVLLDPIQRKRYTENFPNLLGLSEEGEKKFNEVKK